MAGAVDAAPERNGDPAFSAHAQGRQSEQEESPANFLRQLHYTT